ncbi:unnamed protein product [Albugo candida]|uniref:Uncharacterized protein n=1 Tax=Albugo candida TaxID=65357 RepID=A0A024GC26_9STRA|nr:unnamed protein product [Albugo candida]|eukprot:CCI44383.1 unnamed protein product [Albugo candida]
MRRGRRAKKIILDAEPVSLKSLGPHSAIKECNYSMDHDESESKTEETVNSDKPRFESLEIGEKDPAESVKEKKHEEYASSEDSTAPELLRLSVSMENCIYSPDYDYDEAETRDKADSKKNVFDVLEYWAKGFTTCVEEEEPKTFMLDAEPVSLKSLGSRSAIKECNYSMDHDESESKTEETVNSDKHTFESLEIGSTATKLLWLSVWMKNCIYSPDYDYDEAETRDKAGSKHHTFDVLECGAKECTTCVEEEESKYLILDEESFLTELLELSIPMDTRIYRPDLDVSEAVANDQLYSNKYIVGSEAREI